MGIGKIFQEPHKSGKNNIFNSVCCSGGNSNWNSLSSNLLPLSWEWEPLPLRPYSSHCFSNSLFGDNSRKILLLFYKCSRGEANLTDLEKPYLSEVSQDKRTTFTRQRKIWMSNFRDLPFSLKEQNQTQTFLIANMRFLTMKSTRSHAQCLGKICYIIQLTGPSFTHVQDISGYTTIPLWNVIRPDWASCTFRKTPHAKEEERVKALRR